MRLLDFFAYYAWLNAKAKNLPDSFAVGSLAIMIGTVASGLGTLVVMMAAYALSGYVLIHHKAPFVVTFAGLFFVSYMSAGFLYGRKRFAFIISDQFKPFTLGKSAGVGIAVTAMMLSLVLCMATAVFMGVK
jgi:hypothetical protein